jgi:hypothetical protein
VTQDFTQCDCCDFFTILEGEDYEICPVCFWQQDAFGIREPDEKSGANHGLTLRAGRANFRAFGACEEKFKTNVLAASERSKFFHEARNF